LAPELWRSGERSLILPKKLGDLEDPKYLEQIKGKINKMKLLNDMLEAGLINQAQYISKKDKILSGM